MSPAKRRPSPVNTSITSSFFKHANAWLTPIIMTPIRLATNRLTPTTATTPTVSVWGNFRRSASSSRENEQPGHTDNNVEQSSSTATEFADQSWTMLLISPMNPPRSSRSLQHVDENGLIRSISDHVKPEDTTIDGTNNSNDDYFSNSNEMQVTNPDYLMPDLNMSSTSNSLSGPSVLLQPVDYFLSFNNIFSTSGTIQDFSQDAGPSDTTVYKEKGKSRVRDIYVDNELDTSYKKPEISQTLLNDTSDVSNEEFTDCTEYRYLLELMKEHGNEHLYEECTQKKKGLYNCSHCTERFSTIKAFVEHLDKHKVQRPYKCCYAECPWFFVGFSNRPESRRHMKYQHEQAAAIPCPDPSCDRRFSRRDSMKRHYSRIHKNSMPRHYRRDRTL